MVRKITCLDETKKILKKIEEKKNLNSFITVDKHNTLKQAEEADERYRNGNARELEAMLIAVKDNINVKGMKTTCGSNFLKNYESVYDATVIQRIKNAGGIIIGKTNLDEFAMGSSNENSYFGAVRNPVDPEYVAGGSSGGSAAAVAAGLAHAALGSDTGGSVRLPASFCGVYGFKPSYGALSRYGLVEFSSSLDEIGIIGADIDDIERIFDVSAGEDEFDAASVNIEFDTTNNTNSFTAAVLKKEALAKCSKEVKDEYEKFIEKMKDSGGEIIEIGFESSDLWLAAYYIISAAEASSNLARFDGMRYGLRKAETGDDFYSANRSEGFGDEVKRRILAGTFVLSEGYRDKYYEKAMKARRFINDEYSEIFKKADVVCMPTAPFPPFKLGDKYDKPLDMYEADYFTAPANLAGIPAISIPAGFTDDGLPIGVQIQSSRFNDKKLLNLSKIISGNT